MKSVTKIIAATIAISTAAIPASQAFAASKTENALIGAAIGALGGALVSNGTKGVLAGAAAGAAVGIITDKPDRPTYARSYATPTRAYRTPTRTYRQAQVPVYSDRYGQPVYRQSGYGYEQPVRYSAPPRYTYGYGY